MTSKEVLPILKFCFSFKAISMPGIRSLSISHPKTFDLYFFLSFWLPPTWSK